LGVEIRQDLVLSGRENERFVKKFLFVWIQEVTPTGILERRGIFVKVVQVCPKCGETLFVARRL
jgi:hypothetical protein